MYGCLVPTEHYAAAGLSFARLAVCDFMVDDDQHCVPNARANSETSLWGLVCTTVSAVTAQAFTTTLSNMGCSWHVRLCSSRTSMDGLE